MAEAVHDTHDSHVHHGPPPKRTGLKRWTAPGWYRVIWCIPLFFLIGVAIVALIRWAAHWDPAFEWYIITTVSLTTVPIGFLVGLGGFDYWVRYASGRPTIPDDHSGHGARRWQDYFR